MIVLVAACVGALFGGFQAKRREGNRMDIAQYAVGYGIAFALVGLLITVILLRTVG